MEENNSVEAIFYKKCGELLGIPHSYTHRYEYKTRWNNRHSGNGRYPGWGLIRRYSSNNIHVCAAGINKLFSSECAVLLFLSMRKSDV